MKENFLLHHDVLQLDEQIKMLIKNRITVEEIAHNFSHLIPQKDGEGEEIVRATLNQEEQILYGQMFFELQHNPIYLVRAARSITGSAAMGNFTNTVLLTIFGDQYDNNDEQMLLVMLREMLRKEFESTKEVGTFMRTNSVLTQMLSTYVRRPGSINAIKEMLLPIIDEIIDLTDSLEVNPHKVYMELINSFEQNTGEKSPLERSVDQDAAAANDDVKAATAERLKKIVDYAERILKALEKDFAQLLYGIRYITLQLKTMAKERWPDITNNQTNAIMGGFFFLRFINPIIVTPDGSNVTSKKTISKVARRNLTLIAKVLQNLSNGVVFGAKEAFFTPVNAYIEGNTQRLDALFTTLSGVDDVEEAMEMDKFLLVNTVELTATRTLKITYNEIMQVHSLFKDNFKEIILKENTQDSLARIIFMLQSTGPKKEVPRSENSTFTLTLDPMSLAERNSVTGGVRQKGPRLSVWDREVNARGRAVSRTNEMAKLGFINRQSSVSDANQELEKQTKLRLSSIFAKLDLQSDEVLGHLGQKREEVMLEQVLNHAKNAVQTRLTGGKEGEADRSLLEEINAAIEDVATLRLEVYCSLDEAEEGEDPDIEILREVHDAYVMMNKAQIKVERNVHRLKGALDTIEKQHEDLNDQINTWKAYLENVKAMAMGGKSKTGAGSEIEKKRAQMKKTESNKSGWFGKKKDKKVDKCTFSYPELVKKNVIVKSEIPSSAQSSVNFTFRVSPDVPGMFVVVAQVRGFEAHRATLLLEDLLGEQDRGKENYEMDNVTLSVNMLIHLLNTNFGGRSESA
jgi:Ras GTPase-activating-like protein IQGAP2/3